MKSSLILIEPGGMLALDTKYGEIKITNYQNYAITADTRASSIVIKKARKPKYRNPDPKESYAYGS